MISLAVLASALLGVSQAQQSDWKFDPQITTSGQQKDIPFFGFGTWSLPNNDAGAAAVKSAIEVGYRHIDGATAYRNQVAVGKGIKQALEANKNIKREDLWITSKIWSTRHPTAGADQTQAGLQANLDQLGVEYLDLALVHFPVGTDAKGDPNTGVNDIVPMWKAMEKLLDLKNNATGKPLVRKIGISNYNVSQIEELLAAAKVKPYVHQIELHPYLQQTDFLDFHKKHGIPVVAYAPLGNTNPEYTYRAKMTKPLLHDETLNRIAKKRGCASAAQVSLAWNVKRGITVIPKAEKVAHQKENYLTNTQCKLTDADMAAIKRLDVKARFWDMCCTLGQACYLGLDGQLDETPVSNDYCVWPRPAGQELASSKNPAIYRQEKSEYGSFQLPVAFKGPANATIAGAA